MSLIVVQNLQLFVGYLITKRSLSKRGKNIEKIIKKKCSNFNVFFFLIT